MKTLFKITLIFAVVIFVLSCKKQKDTITISGKFKIPNVKEIYLLRADKLINPYLDTTAIKVPVIDSAFYYEIPRPKQPIVLELNYSLSPATFNYFPLFIKDNDIDVIIEGNEYYDKIITGGKLNKDYKKYIEDEKEAFKSEFAKTEPLNNCVRILEKEFNFKTKEIKRLELKLEKTEKQKEKDVIKKQIEKINKQIEECIHVAEMLEDKAYEKEKVIYLKKRDYCLNYIQNNTNFISYYLLLQKLRAYSYHSEFRKKLNIDINKGKELYKILKKEFPNHPYNKRIEYLISKIESVQVGKPFIDFSAPDLNGKEHKLSNEIKGKVSLLDLWSTTCGGCIRTTKSIIPLYNQFKDKGFTIVGVAGEFKNTDNLVKSLEKEKWSWLNLVELDKKNNIWKTYGVDGGGRTFLIDKKGIVIAINPTAEQIKLELEKRLK